MLVCVHMAWVCGKVCVFLSCSFYIDMMLTFWLILRTMNNYHNKKMICDKDGIVSHYRKNCKRHVLGYLDIYMSKNETGFLTNSIYDGAEI